MASFYQDHHDSHDPQFEHMLGATPEANIFYTPINNLPERFQTRTNKELTAAYREVIAEQLSPALQRLNHFIHDEYLPASRDTSGLAPYPTGQPGIWRASGTTPI